MISNFTLLHVQSLSSPQYTISFFPFCSLDLIPVLLWSRTLSLQCCQEEAVTLQKKEKINKATSNDRHITQEHTGKKRKIEQWKKECKRPPWAKKSMDIDLFCPERKEGAGNTGRVEWEVVLWTQGELVTRKGSVLGKTLQAKMWQIV